MWEKGTLCFSQPRLTQPRAAGRRDLFWKGVNPSNDWRWTRVSYRLLGDQGKKWLIWSCESTGKRHLSNQGWKGNREVLNGQWERSESNEWDGLNRRKHCEATQVSGRWQHFTTGRPESAERHEILSRTTQRDTNTWPEISSSPRCYGYSTMQNTGEQKKSRSDEKKHSSQNQLVHFSPGHIPAKF